MAATAQHDMDEFCVSLFDCFPDANVLIFLRDKALGIAVHRKI